MATIDEEIKSKFIDNKHRLLVNLIFTAGWIKSSFADSLKPYNISTPQYNILRILRGAKDWVAMNDVKSLMVEKSPNATRLTDKLLDRGLIERKRSEEDRRVVFVKIAEKGLAFLSETDQNEDWQEKHRFLANITDEEAKQFSAMLDKLRG